MGKKRQRARELAQRFLEGGDALGWVEECGLIEKSFEDFVDDEDPPVRRFRAVYERRRS